VTGSSLQKVIPIASKADLSPVFRMLTSMKSATDQWRWRL
jgi:hypothetical protein